MTKLYCASLDIHASIIIIIIYSKIIIYVFLHKNYDLLRETYRVSNILLSLLDLVVCIKYFIVIKCFSLLPYSVVAVVVVQYLYQSKNCSLKDSLCSLPPPSTHWYSIKYWGQFLRYGNSTTSNSFSCHQQLFFLVVFAVVTINHGLVHQQRRRCFCYHHHYYYYYYH